MGKLDVIMLHPPMEGATIAIDECKGALVIIVDVNWCIDMVVERGHQLA